MLLGRSSDERNPYDLNGTVRNDVESGVEHGAALLRFSAAAVGRTDDLAASRSALESEMSAAAVVDCAATIANFQRIVRIADGCGIPLDEFTRERYPSWRDGLQIEHFRSRQNTFA